MILGFARYFRWSGAMACLVLSLALARCATHSPTEVAVSPLPESGGTGATPVATLMAGAAVRVITPDLGTAGRTVYVGGLSRGLPAAGVNDELFARAVVVSDGDGVSVGLVVLDLIGFFNDDVVKVREELRARHPEVVLDHLAVASTHTHAGPDVIGLWLPIGSSVDAEYVALVRSRAVDAIAEAWRGRRPAELFVGASSAPGLAKDTRLPELTDDTVLVMGLRGRDDRRPIATVVNWNSHPSVAGKDNAELSADFPMGTVALMERDWGGVCIYTSGALGGQIGSGRVRITDPLTGQSPATRARRAELIGEKLGGIALAALKEAEARGPAAAPAVHVRHRDIMIPLDNVRFVTGLSIGLIHPRRLWPRDGGGEGLLPSELPDPTSLRPGFFSLRSEVAVIDVGPARWALVPGELYPELSLGQFQDPQDSGADFQGAEREFALRPGSDRSVFIIGLANDELGYIIPRSQWDSEPPYAYGLDEPQYGEMNSAGPQTAPIVMRAFQELLAQPI